MGGYAWVTLATNDAYSLGALVLAHSLRQVGTKYDLACLITPGVTATMREKLTAVFSLVQEVNVLDSKDEANLALLTRPELGITFTKLHCWRLTQYEKCVFVDADALVVRNCDELFEREELSAAPDVGWPDCFNSGVFVFRPSQQTFASITAFAAAKGSFDGGDQGLLNMYFSDWASKDISKHLPFIYNMCSTATYSYLPAFKQFGEDVRIIHFIGITKPWLQYFDTLTGVVQPPPGVGHLQPLLQHWWNIFCERVHPQLSISMASSTLAPIWHAFASPFYVPPNPTISVYSDATNNDVYSQTPDFSEFKDPWEKYSPQDDLFPSNNSAQSDNYYCAPAPQHNQQSHCEQYTRNEQHWEHATSHSGENQSHSVQHTEHHQWNEQRHHHEQFQHNEQHHQHHEQRYHEQRRYNGQRQHSEHHQHSESCRNKADDHHIIQHRHGHNDNERQSIEVKYEVHTQHYTNDSSQASHRDADCQNYSQGGHVTDNESHCYRCNEKSSSEQSLKATDQQTNTRRIDSHPLPPIPCTDLHNVATRSDPNVTEHLDDANAGLAGALAQLTLGEARSAEQIALEEHIRKQSWEQGHIDYLGRDSFDNIWKKICETLSLAPQREPTPPQENVPQVDDEPAVTVAPVEADKPAVEVDKDPTQCLVCKVSDETLSVAPTPKGEASFFEQSVTVETATTKVSSESAQPAALEEDACAKPTTDPKDVILRETSTEVPLPKPLVESPLVKTIEQCQLSSPQTTQEASSPGESLLLAIEEPQTFACLLADAVCKKKDTSVTRTDSASAPIEARPEIPTSATQDTTQPAAAPINADSPQSIVVPPFVSQAPVADATKRAAGVTQPLTIDPSERHAEMLLAASEISTVSPVPIQVAESVLQAEPKESVSGATVSVSDQAISTTVTAVHESTDVVPAATAAELVQLNGSDCEVAAVVAAISSLPEKTDAPAEPTKESTSDSATTIDAPLETPSITEKKVEFGSSVVPSLSAKAEKSTEPVETETKPPKQIAKTDTTAVKSPEAEITQAVAEQPETIKEASSEVPETPVAEQSPSKEEYAETKISNIPSTPTVIEATPPTSPSAESAQETEEKVAKKSLKKSDSAEGADGEGADKKTKKTAKKVVKRPKAKPEEAAFSPTSADGADGSQSKTKKTVKVVKKTATKTGQTLETDTSVPETPPPPSSGSADAPVPPKRKTKSSSANAKGTKKPEAEE